MVQNKENLLYFLDEKPYINMTNACTNACVFCVRDQKDDVQGANLWMDKDDITALDVINQIEENKKAILKQGEAMQYARETLRQDVLFVIEVSKTSETAFQYANYEIRNNANIVLKIIEKNEKVMQYIGDELATDEAFLLDAVHTNMLTLQYISKEMRNNKEFMLSVIQTSGVFALNYISQNLKEDKEFLLEAMKINPLTIQFIDERLQQDIEFMNKLSKYKM